MRNIDFTQLKTKLDKLGENFDYRARVATDPVRFVGRFENPADIETAALILGCIGADRALVLNRQCSIFSI